MRYTLLDNIPIRIRLALGFALVMGLIFTVIGFGVYRVAETSIYESVDSSLLASARSIRENHVLMRAWDDHGNSGDLMDSFLEDIFGFPQVTIRSYARLVDMSGQVRRETNNAQVSLPVTPLAIAAAEAGNHIFESFKWKDFPLQRQVTLPVMNLGRFTGELIQVGTSMKTPLRHLANIERLLWVVMPLGLLLAVLCGYVLTKRSLRPVTSISQAASRISSDNMGERLPLPPANDELRILTKTYNEMINRVEDGVSRLRRFAGDVSHELRTPLAVLRAESEFALRKPRSNEEYQKALEVVARESSSMTKIVDDLLLLTRAQGRALDCKWQRIRFDKFVDQVHEQVSKVISDRNVLLKVESCDVSWFHGCEMYLAIVMANLVRNAAKHSPVGGQILLRVERSGSDLVFLVRDWGEGIPAKDLPFIFDPFFRSDTARNRGGSGVGIGLSLAHALVALHGGELSAKSVVGKGSDFQVRLPQPADKDSNADHEISLKAPAGRASESVLT